MFSALKEGSILYVLDKTAKPVIKVGRVEHITAPRPMYKQYNPTVSFNLNLQTVVDVTLKIDGAKKDFIGLPSTENMHSHGDYVVSETKEAMISEVDAMLQRSKSIIESVDAHKENIEACEEILRELDPSYAKEQERDTAIDSLTEQVTNMQSVLRRLEALLTKDEDEDDKELYKIL